MKMHKPMNLTSKSFKRIGGFTYIKTACGMWQKSEHIAMIDEPVTCKRCLRGQSKL